MFVGTLLSRASPVIKNPGAGIPVVKIPGAGIPVIKIPGLVDQWKESFTGPLGVLMVMDHWTSVNFKP